MLTGFPRTRWPRRRFSESYVARISVKISRIYEFRVTLEIVTEGDARLAPERAGRMMQSKSEPSEDFDVIIRPAPEGAGRTAPNFYPINITWQCAVKQPIEYPLPHNAT